ncbi:MAG: hypothetical protein IIC93_10860 [Chloroflexi bacterium]|nr:hypothetical protein [Chloroflexota bacterium]
MADLIVNQLPPHLNNPMAMEADARHRGERMRKGGLAGMSTSALIFVMPFALVFLGIRKVYRKATGYTPPPKPEPEKLTPSELKAVMKDLCPGSGGEFDGDAKSATCGRCGKATGVAYGKFMTHGW